ncbi:regulatory LuxR family protein [Silicimonas algicola]|uniref:Regulatory LuxR family protein n=2 Tax=Silicimonas algicola TaxID=1826607 RepID=A0A316G669_9RHOB|nr:regulatory LuxR family protein [Silicimonas algicola]
MATRNWGLVLLMAVQGICAVFFIVDVFADIAAEGGMSHLTVHMAVETLATLTLIAAMVLEARFFVSLLRHEVALEQDLAVAAAEVHEAIRAQFKDWKLSPAESDVAMFLVKGLGTAEIAEMRGSAEGTIKAHFNAVFRKAGVHSRAELLSMLIDRILAGRLPDAG